MSSAKASTLRWLIPALLLTAVLGFLASLLGGPYTVLPLGTRQVFFNRVDGYRLTLPEDAEIDTSMEPIRTAVTLEGVTLYIYPQRCEDFDPETYIGYSGQSLNHPDFTITDSGAIGIAGLVTDFARWSRRPLSRVAGDLPNYACYDIRSGGKMVYTLYFKYASEADFEKTVVPIRDSFRAKAMTAMLPEPRMNTGEAPEMNEETAALYRKLFLEDGPVTWGIYQHDTVEGMEKMNALQERLDFRFHIFLLYSHFYRTAPTINQVPLYDMLRQVCAQGQIPELTLQTSGEGDTLMMLDILDGEYDDYLRQYARDVARFASPVLFRLCNEMNGDWCSYCSFWFCRDTDLFLEMYRYVYEVFQQEGADNVIWVWNPNHKSFPDFNWNDERLYYPGDSYVNVVGLTAYNTGTYYEGETWQSFDQLYRPLYASAAARYHRPMMITEFSCSNFGGDKLQWVRDMFDSIEDYPLIRAAVWWNGQDMDNSTDPPTVARSYRLDYTEDMLDVFREGFSRFPSFSPGE